MLRSREPRTDAAEDAAMAMPTQLGHLDATNREEQFLFPRA
jgi:hypothetical protein